MIKQLCAALLLGVSGQAAAAIINFDDITTSGSGSLSSTYQGYQWSSGWYVHSDQRYQNVYKNSYGSISGEYAAFNGFGRETMTLKSSGLFDFTGAFFSAWAWRDNLASFSSRSITVAGYRSGSLIDQLTMQLSADQFDWLQADFLDIDELRLMSSNNRQWWLIDDLTLNESGAFNTSALVSEPGSIVLICLGLWMLSAVTFYPRMTRIVKAD